MADRQWELPPLAEVLDEFSAGDNKSEALAKVDLIERTLADFGVAAQVRDVRNSPRLTRFSLKPKGESQISQIKKLAPDLSLALSGALAQIEEPTPSYPYVSLLVENYRQPNVRLRRVLESVPFRHHQGRLKIGLGLDTFDQPVVIDLAALPHLLIGGTTGSGKSACLNATIASLLCTYTPERLRLLLIDPNRVELTRYNGVPHLVTPVLTGSTQVLPVLERVIEEIEQRYSKFSQLQVRDIESYNQRAGQAGRRRMPYLVIIVDNLFDLMLSASKELEKVLTRIAQKARAAGIHLILSTLRSGVGTVSGSIKANFPARIAFRVTDSAESRLILDVGGAEDLLGNGDMLYKSPHTNQLQRVQGIHPSEQEMARLVNYWRPG